MAEIKKRMGDGGSLVTGSAGPASEQLLAVLQGIADDLANLKSIASNAADFAAFKAAASNLTIATTKES